jgi:predicted site-specific integrase-resolvase
MNKITAPTTSDRHPPEAVAKRFGVHKKTLQSWMKKRLISYVKLGGESGRGRAVVFFREEDLISFENRFRRRAVGENN